ncbi:MAG: polyprenyl synthetase family protein, partial [Luminiphilus sp.]
LVLLAAGALDDISPDDIKFAAVVEFIHTATLLHDDVVDLSTLRRGRATANAEFGNAPSVLVGDFIYTRAFQLMVSLGNLPLLQHMADTTNTIAAGEVLQLMRAGDPSVTESQYVDVIERKTAALFAAACRGSAILRGLDHGVEEQMGNFGRHLGIAFQMVDDVLDYTGDPEITGKQVGDDLNEGKPTLPLIYTMAAGTADDAAIVRDALAQKDSSNLAGVIAAVRRSGGIEYTREQAVAHQQSALAALSDLAPSPALTAMHALADMAINRER